MSCCCQRIYRMCAVYICDGQPVSIPIPVTTAGAYTMELEFLDTILNIDNEQVVGSEMLFDKDQLNERFTYIGRVLDIAGNPMPFEIDGEDYDCFEFSTKRKIYEPAGIS